MTAGLALIALGAGGCSPTESSAPTTTVLGQTPSTRLTAVQEAESWFKAINAKNQGAAQAHYEADQRYNIGNWDRGDVSMWPSFTNVHCRPFRHQAREAVVYCSFKSHGGDGSASADTFWNVELHRTAGGPWLITNYGQG